MSNFALEGLVYILAAAAPAGPVHAQISESYIEVISDAPAGAEAWNGTRVGHAGFLLDVSLSEVRVTVRVASAARPDATQAWEKAIEAKWSRKQSVSVAGHRVPVVIDAQFVTSDRPADHAVQLVPDTLDEAHWSEDDTVGVTHEFGHMLGNADEYYTVNGVHYGARGSAQVMGTPKGKAAPRHYEFIRSMVQRETGETVTLA